MTKEELKDNLRKMVKSLTKYSSVFKDFDFKLSSIKECNGAYYVESRSKPKIEFWIVENECDNVKKKSGLAYKFCIAYEISESLSNEDIVDCIPSIWWIGDTGILDKKFYNQVIFEYDDVDLEKYVDFKKFMKGKEKNEFEQANKCLKSKSCSSEESRYVIYYLKSGKEKDGIKTFEKNYTLFKKCVDSIEEIIEQKEKYDDAVLFKPNEKELFLVPPQKYKCEEIVIVGPYPTLGFVERVVSELNISPSNITIVVDSSWRQDIIKLISERGSKIVYAQTENGNGIVHAKMYYVKYAQCTQLFLGSVNASENSVNNNAEFISSYILDFIDETSRNEIHKYFQNLKEGKSVLETPIHLKKENNVYSHLLFPEIKIVEKDFLGSFKNWIRKGFFFIKYDPDPNLGFLSVDLKGKGEKTELDETLEETKSIFERSKKKNFLRYQYTANAKEIKEKKGQDKWKSKYGVETEMGCWISRECLDELKNNNITIPPKNIYRYNIVNSIKNMQDFEIDKKKDIVLNEVKKLKKAKNGHFKNLIDDPNEDKIKEKIKSDKLLVADEVYQKRYVEGYAVIPASELNHDFIDCIITDFIDTCIINSNKTKKSSLTKRIDEIRKKRKNQQTEIIKKELEINWQNYKDDICNYYRDALEKELELKKRKKPKK
jgi:hypothetical protein